MSKRFITRREEAMRVLESDRARDTLESTHEQTRDAFMPYVIETTHRGERTMDIFTRLLKDRIVFLGSEINDDIANLIIAQLLFLESEDPDKEIMLYINSPGGVVTAGLAIYDTMQYVRSVVSTACIGQAASMGAVLLGGGQKTRRSALPNSRILIHQPLGGVRGQATDIEIHAREILHLKERLTDILQVATGQDRAKLRQDMERDFYMGAVQAKEYGLIDEVFLPKKNIKTTEKKDEKSSK